METESMQATHSNELSFRDDVALDESGPTIKFQTSQFEFTISEASDQIRAAFRKIAGGSISVQQLREPFLEEDVFYDWLTFKQYLDNMPGLLCYTLRAGKQELMTIEPLPYVSAYRFEMHLAKARTLYTLSRFAYLRRVERHLVLECSIGHARIVLLHPAATEILTNLEKPHTCEEIASIFNLDVELAMMFVDYLLNARALTTVEAADAFPDEDNDVSLAHWEFHDLTFHTRTRLGRHGSPYGGTYRFKGRFEPLPPIKNDTMGTVISLHTPDMNRLSETDPPFSAVLEQRRSIRHYAENPISEQQLGEFLYRVARIKKVFAPDLHGQELCFRPYPAGGAIHELEIYPIINNCDGLPKGLFHYNPVDHQLKHMTDKSEAIDRLLNISWQTLKRESHPHVLFVITARFQRVQWKYQSMAYALILKNVGVLYQTMYLVATAMGLAPCALGGGHSDLFATTAGLNYYAETSVGEFAIGSRGCAPPDIGRPYQPRPNPD